LPSTNDKRPARQALVFDFGERRIGVASANALGGTASGLATLAARDGRPVDLRLDELLHEWRPDLLVVGLPYNDDGSESSMTGRAREFADWLAGQTGLPVEMVDERYTSAEAESILRDQRQEGTKKRRTRKQDIDRLAARLIAESWLRGAAVTGIDGDGN
jgi:putative Holliday junction resolvase